MDTNKRTSAITQQDLPIFLGSQLSVKPGCLWGHRRATGAGALAAPRLQPDAQRRALLREAGRSQDDDR
ncbi:MAG: hypothetical protein LBV61_00220 [Burkholderiaceae bacterium]|nr:hypothetical protein [Burkholderiaceae bacterium]